jgi:hypothetical protein
MLVSPDPGGDDHVSGLQQGLRLSDAEGIAAERLDGAAEGSLKEALAIAPAEDASNAAPLPSDPVGAVDEKFTAGPLIRLDGAAEGSLKEALAIAPAEDASNTAPQPADPVGAVDERLTAGPLVRLIDAQFAEAGRTHIHAPTFAFSLMPRPPVLDLGIALAAPADSAPPPALAAPEIAGGDESPSASTEDRQGFVGEVPPASAAAPAPDTAAPQGMEPLASALDAAVRLAADASVAAEALENLKRLLEHKQQLESRLPQLAGAPAPAPTSDNAEASAATADAPAAPALPPLPLPLHAASDTGGELAPAMLPPSSRRRPLPERRGLDVRGFLAGFALSWAFGVVLYLFITAG